MIIILLPSSNTVVNQTWNLVFSFNFYKGKLLTKSICVQSWLYWRFGEKGKRRHLTITLMPHKNVETEYETNLSKVLLLTLTQYIVHHLQSNIDCHHFLNTSSSFPTPSWKVLKIQLFFSLLFSVFSPLCHYFQNLCQAYLMLSESQTDYVLNIANGLPILLTTQKTSRNLKFPSPRFFLLKNIKF